MSVNSDKLQLWLDRYKVTAREYYDRILSKPNVRITPNFFETIQELLNGYGEHFAFLFDNYEDFQERNIYRFSENAFHGDSIWTLPEKESVTDLCMTADFENIYVYNNNKIYVVNIETSEFETITLNGYTPDPGVSVEVTRRFINDGINDMYDGGNFINTNHTAVWAEIAGSRIRSIGELMLASVEYTNAQDSISTTAVDGIDYFGLGSTYLTSKFDKCFFLGAVNTDITEFSISGELGADGQGIVSTTYFEKLGYQIFVKMVSEANDPALHHIIMVPDTQVNAEQYTPESTHSDDDRIYNLTAPEELYYFAIGNESGTALTYNELDALTTSLIAEIDTDLETTALNLSNNLATILNDYAFLISFSDEGAENQTIGDTSTVSPIEIVNKGGQFTLINNDGFLFAVDSLGGTTISPFQLPVFGIICACLSPELAILIIDSEYRLQALPSPEEVILIGSLDINADFTLKIADIISFVNVGTSYYVTIFGLNLDEDYLGQWLCEIDITTAECTVITELPNIFFQITPVITINP